MVKETSEWTSKFNPYNSDKLFAQVPRWEGIENWKDGKGELPAPTTVSIDPANICDISCKGCNANFIMQRNHNLLSKETLMDIANFLPTWEEAPYNVKSVCIGGGGESLLNPHTGEFIQNLVANGINAGVVTNGTHIPKHLDSLCEAEWVGVSVDAATAETYGAVKGAYRFNQVIGNMRELVRRSESMNSTLAMKGRGHGVNYKYLLRPETVGEVYEATKIAKDIGCRSLHIRPISPSWDNVGKATDTFNAEDIYKFREQLEASRELEDENFGVYGVTHKFNGDFSAAHDFKKCNGIYMSTVLMPPTDKDKGVLDMSYCCDRRGDDLLTHRNLSSVEDIKNHWRSDGHKSLIDKLDVGKCPRCTFSPHQKIYENVIEVNNMTPDFI